MEEFVVYLMHTNMSCLQVVVHLRTGTRTVRHFKRAGRHWP